MQARYITKPRSVGGYLRHVVVLTAGIALCATGVPLYANVQEIRPRPNGDWKGNGHGEMNIRLRVDQEAEVTVRGDRVRVHTISGRWVTEEGSTMSAPLPFTNARIDFSKKDGRGKVWVVQQPSAANRYQLVFRISDPQGGMGRYHIRLRYPTAGTGWQQSAVRPPAPPRHGYGFSPRGHDDSAWSKVSFRRPGSWNRMPGVPLDPRRMERVSDVHGRNGGRFEFRGRVDEEVLFFLRGNQVTVQTRVGRSVEVERWSLDEPVPVGRPLQIRMSTKDGRGMVDLLEPPHPGNNYTAVIRVYDPRGGSDRYHFRMDWQY
jgi:hypothetical protein